MVAADHWRVIVLQPQSILFDDAYKLGFNAGYAVMFFYMVSGFLITFTLTRNYDRDLRGTFKFYKNRFIRIFSLYWPLVVIPVGEPPRQADRPFPAGNGLASGLRGLSKGSF